MGNKILINNIELKMDGIIRFNLNVDNPNEIQIVMKADASNNAKKIAYEQKDSNNSILVTGENDLIIIESNSVDEIDYNLEYAEVKGFTERLVIKSQQSFFV